MTTRTTATAEPPTSVDQAARLITLRPEQIAAHPDNIRDATRGIDALAASIAEVGVLVPLIVVPAAKVEGQWADGVTHIAIDGARRLPAAAQAGATVPCIVRPDLASALETVRTMAVTVLARDGLTDTEEAHAVQTMLDLGLTQRAISRATGRSAKRVRAAKKAATIPPSITDRAPTLALDQLADLAEFADDEQATNTLLDAAGSGRWEHTLARLRRDARERAAIDRHVTRLVTDGITATADDTFPWQNRVERLRQADGEPITDHTGCPGHRVLVQADYSGRTFETAFCDDPDTNGHTRPGDRPHDPVDDEEAAAQREADREARRALVRLNKSALAAQQVRRAFLHHSLAAKTRHKKMVAWAMARLAQRDETYTAQITTQSATDVLRGITGSDDPDRDAATAAPTRHALLVWATVCAAYESDYPKDAHRQVSPELAAYLDHLADLGYQPSETDDLVREAGHAEATRRAELAARWASPEPDAAPPLDCDDARNTTEQADPSQASQPSGSDEPGAADTTAA